LNVKIGMHIIDTKPEKVEKMNQLKQELSIHKTTMDRLVTESRMYKFIERTLIGDFQEAQLREYMKAIQNAFVLYSRHIEKQESSILNETILKSKIIIVNLYK
jgi:hypothetical protein